MSQGLPPKMVSSLQDIESILVAQIFCTSRIDFMTGCQGIEHNEKKKEQKGREHIY